MSRNVLMLAVAGTLMIASGTAAADIRTTTFEARATVNANCLVSAGALDFLGYDGTMGKTANSAISVRCSTGTPFTVLLNAGGGTFTQRLLSNGSTNRLQYNLYTTASITGPVWGDGTGGTGTMGGTGAGMSINNALPFTVYGDLPDTEFNQGAPAGLYTDTILVTVSY